MTISNIQLLDWLNDLLEPHKVKDYCPNGLQVEGKSSISKVVTGVTASQALIDSAIQQKADTIIVHHGYFWKGESPEIKGMKRNRLKALLTNDINLFAYHLPLDVHSGVGNNVQLAQQLDISVDGDIPIGPGPSVLLRGHFDKPHTPSTLKSHLEAVLGRDILVEAVPDKTIRTVAWCTGGGQNFIELAADLGIDAFITGEVSEQTIHTAREMDIAFFASGHHATERYGVKALGERLQDELGIDVTFIDIDNPA